MKQQGPDPRQEAVRHLAVLLPHLSRQELESLADLLLERKWWWRRPKALPAPDPPQEEPSPREVSRQHLAAVLPGLEPGLLAALADLAAQRQTGPVAGLPAGL